MNSLIKIIIGILIGVLGFWVVNKSGLTQQQIEVQAVEQVPEQEVDNESITAAKNKDGKLQPEADSVEQVTQEDVIALQQQLFLKEQQLAAVATENKRLQQILNTGKSAPMESGDNSEKTPAADVDRLAGIPESHHSLLSRPASMPKSTFELHDELVSEEEDVSWATMKEQQINHYLQTHKQSANYVVHKVDCRQTLCEIVGTEYPSGQQVWVDVSGQMRTQAWWEFTGTHTSSSIDDVGNYIFVTLLRRNKTGTI
ncbi:MAG: hypothetical protein HUJ16_09620 [Kangiella sp.]|nr:hypothetical protein [Kangiella sp.]